ncbi:MAG: glycosyltransferase family 4 protein [Ignisphaera sp.]
MNILIFSELYYPHGGGAELATWLYSKMLAEKGFKIIIVTRQFPGEPSLEFINNSLEIIRIPMKTIYESRYYTLFNLGVLASSLIRRLIKESDIIYVPGSWFSVIPFAKIYKKPVIVHLHNYSLVCPTSLMYDFINQRIGSSSLKSFILHEYIEKKRSVFFVAASGFMNELLGKRYNKLGSLADALIFVSKTQRELVLSRFPSLKNKSYVVYNPIPYLPLIEAKQKGLSYLGGRSFVKGFVVFIRALKLLRNSLEVYLLKSSKKPLKLFMNNGIILNLLPRINREDFPRLMQKTSIVAIPSIWPEPLPYTLVESMLYGKLIVASKIGGIPEILTDDLEGVKLVEPGNYVQIADSINQFLVLDLEEINEAGFKNREYILKKLNNENILNSFIKILYSIV